MSALQARGRRIVELQRQLLVARRALEKIKHGCRDPEGIADEAMTEIWPLDHKQPLQRLVGHDT